MHIADVKVIEASGAAGLVIELGYVPSYVKITNSITGKFVEYINEAVGLSTKAVADGLVTPTFVDGTYLLNGIKTADSKLRRTDPGSLGVKAVNGEGLILDDVLDVNDADEATSDGGNPAPLVVVAYRGDL